MNQFVYTESIVIGLLLVVALVSIGVRRLSIPYTVALVLAGLLISFQHPFEINLTPELILVLFVPPLVFEAAFHLDLQELQRNFISIVLLTVPGVIATMLIVSGLVAWGTALSLPVVFVFGALMAATDPTAVVASFRRLRVPERLTVLMEGESLLNDGTAIVLFSLVLAVALTNRFDPVQGIFDFVRVAAGGTVVGLALGWMISALIARIDDYLVETTLTTVLAFGGYLVADRLNLSGVLAVVAAGLVNGNLGPRGMSPTTRLVLFNFWEYVAFLANSLLFLLIGTQVQVSLLLAAWQPILWAIFAVLISRALIVLLLGFISKLNAESIPGRWQPVLFWGGLRGAISLALVLSLPVALGPERELLRAMTFGVILFTLLVQGTTMRPLLGWLQIHIRRENEVDYETRRARLTAMQAAQNRLSRLHREGLISTHTWDILNPQISQRISDLTKAVGELLLAEPALEAAELDTARRELVVSQRDALQTLRRDAVISDEVFEKLTAELDAGSMEPVEQPGPDEDAVPVEDVARMKVEE